LVVLLGGEGLCVGWFVVDWELRWFGNVEWVVEVVALLRLLGALPAQSDGLCVLQLCGNLLLEVVAVACACC
jgi:hypothetical protein